MERVKPLTHGPEIRGNIFGDEIVYFSTHFPASWYVTHRAAKHLSIQDTIIDYYLKTSKHLHRSGTYYDATKTEIDMFCVIVQFIHTTHHTRSAKTRQSAETLSWSHAMASYAHNDIYHRQKAWLHWTDDRRSPYTLQSASSSQKNRNSTETSSIIMPIWCVVIQHIDWTKEWMVYGRLKAITAAF